MSNRKIVIDTNVINQLNRGNRQVAETLRTILKPGSGIELYVTDQAYRELTDRNGKLNGGDGPNVPRMAAADERLMEDLGIKVGVVPPGAWKCVVDTYNKNNKMGNVISDSDLRHAAQAIAMGAELWTFDQSTFVKQEANLKKNLPGLKIAPETTMTVSGTAKSDYRVARQLMGLPPIIVSASGNITEPPPPPGGPGSGKGGPGSGGGGSGGTTAYVGEADMRPIEVGGPSPQGEAKIGGLTLLFQGVNFALNWANDRQNKQAIKDELTRIGPAIARNRSADPSQGVLLVFYFKTAPSDPDSLIQPGPVFRFIEDYYGHTESEATQNWRSSAGTLEPGLDPQTVWIPPIVPPGVQELKTPFKPFALGRFAPGKEVIQDVEFNGVLGFDDEGTKRLEVPEDVTPSFVILNPPSEIRWWNGARYTTTLPLTRRAADDVGMLPVANLDPDLPFFDVTAAMVFPADDDTQDLFDQSRPTKDDCGLLNAFNINIRLLRWVRPANIRILSPWSAAQAPGCVLTSVAPKRARMAGSPSPYKPKDSELAPQSQWGLTLAGPPPVYIVEPLDNLNKIAQKLYGDPSKWKAILDANPGKIDPQRYTIYPGQKLRLPPGLPLKSSAAPAPPKQETKPFDPNLPIA